MKTYFSVCPHDCPDTCAWQVEVKDGKIQTVKGDPSHPVTQGVICEKARYYPQRIYGKERILYPMRRVGPKGSNQFERISWDEAINEIVQRWKKLILNYGPESILPYSYAGTEGVINKSSMDRRFFNKLGASRLERTICSAAGGQGYKLAYGQLRSFNPLDSEKANLIIFWGINALETNIHQALIAEKARKRGAKIIVIDVHLNKTAKWADGFYHILPGSDGALALGIAHVILRDGLVNLDWARKYTMGLDEFTKEAKLYPPERVAQLTGLTQEQIIELARLYAGASPSLIRIGNGFQHHDNGGMSTWAVACLPAITGAWQESGGGAIRHNSGYFPLNSIDVERPDIAQGTPRTVNMIQIGKALTELEPPIRSLYIYNSNMLAIAPEQNLILQGLSREDLFTVVHEQVWTDTALWADIVLPATTSLEHKDLYVSYWHTFLQWAEPVIPPLGESKPNIEVFQTLAKKMGFTDGCFEDTAEDIARQALNLPYWLEKEITLERLQKEQFIEVQVPERPFAEGGVPTSSGKVELRSQLAVTLGLSEVPSYRPLIEGPETKKMDYPLTLISPPNHSFLNSTFVDVQELKEKAGQPTLEIHSSDADIRGIKDGDLITVFNSRGSVILRAQVANSVLPGVVVALGVWWPKNYETGRGINALTPDRLSDIGHGAVFFSNLVEVSKVKEIEQQEIP